jgi:hypothetical protein
MRILKVHRHHVRCVAYSPDASMLASGSNDRTVKLLELPSGKEIARRTDFQSPVLCVAFSPDGKTLAASEGQPQVVLWDVQMLLAKTVPSSGIRTLPILDPATWRTSGWEVRTNVPCLAFAPDGRALVAGTGDRQYARGRGELRLWAMPEGKVLASLPSVGGIWGLSFAPDGGVLAVGTGFGFRVCDLVPWSEGTMRKRGTGVKALAFSPDGTTLATVMGRTVILWEVGVWAVRARLQEHSANILSVAYSPDGQTLMTGGWDKTVRLWDPATGRQRAVFSWGLGKVQCLAFAPDGQTAAAACDKGIVIWDMG